MLVELAGELFGAANNNIYLNAIAGLALDGWHRLLLQDESDARVVAWMQALPAEQREQWERVLADAYLLESREPATRRVLVKEAIGPLWAGTKPELPLSYAARYLREPFNLVLEDAVSDKEFLLAVATAEQRQFLETMELIGVLRFEHGGGLGSTHRNVSQVVAGGAPQILRTAVLFDSDALQPNQPNAASERVRSLCSKNGITNHQLRRRSIENYLPKQALQAWAFKGGNRRAKRRAFQAFVQLGDDQRYHFNMKEGFRGDRNRNDADAGALYEDLPQKVVQDLENGFGSSIAELYRRHPRAGCAVAEQHLRADGSWPELSSIVGSIISLVR